MIAGGGTPTVEVMTRNHQTQLVEVSFLGAPPAGRIARASGVSRLQVDGSTVRCAVTGSFQPFLEALHGHEVMTVATADPPLPLARLYLLRAGYLLIGVGQAVTNWPAFFTRDQPWPLMEGVVQCMLLAMSLLAFLGVRHPVRMLPLLLFESAWKVIWLIAVALPLWRTDQMDAATTELTAMILWVVVVVAVIPWRYVLNRYVLDRGDRWRAAVGAQRPTAAPSHQHGNSVSDVGSR